MASMVSEGVDALLLASSECKFRLVRLLIEGGIPVNTRNREQQTPIMLVCKCNNSNEDKAKVVQFLLKMNAKVNLRDVNGKTALIFACLSNSNSIVISSLVNASAHPCIQDNAKKSSLDYAIKSGNLVTIKLLVDALQKQDQILETASDATNVRALAECLSAIHKSRKLSWPLMSNFRRILTPRQRYELSDFEALNESTSQNDLSTMADKNEARLEPNAQRKRKNSICHFGPIDLESILKVNESEEENSTNVPMTGVRRSKKREHQLSRMESIPRASSVVDKISLNFSENESDDFSHLLPCTKQPQPVNSSFPSSLFVGSEHVTDEDPDFHPRVIRIKQTKETFLTYGTNQTDSNPVVNEAKPCDASDATSKNHWVQHPRNSTCSTTKDDRSCRKNSLVTNEGKYTNDLEVRMPSTEPVQPCARPCFFPESPKVCQMVHPSSPRSRRRNSLSISNFEQNAGPNVLPGSSNCGSANASTSARRHTTSSLLQHPSASSQTRYGSDSDLRGLAPGSDLKIQTVSRKLSPTRIILKPELSILDKESNRYYTPLPHGGRNWPQTAGTKNYDDQGNHRRNSDTNLSSNFQLPSLSKRLNKFSLDKNVKVQHVGNKSQVNQFNVLNTNLYEGEEARTRRKSSTDIPDERHSFLQANDNAIQLRSSSSVSTSKCDVISMTTTGYNSKTESINWKPNPLPDLLPHSVLQATYSPQAASKNNEENNFVISGQETTNKEPSAQIVSKYSLPEVVCATTVAKMPHAPVLPPLSNTTTKRLNDE